MESHIILTATLITQTAIKLTPRTIKVHLSLSPEDSLANASIKKYNLSQNTFEIDTTMAVNDRLDSFIQQAKSLFPGGNFSAEIEKNLRALAQSAFGKLGMVSQEEFDAQVAVLHRSRQKIEQLEQQLADLSAQLND